MVTFKNIQTTLLAGALALCVGLLPGCKPETATGTDTAKPATGAGAGTTTGAAARPSPAKDGASFGDGDIKIGLVASQNGNLKPWGDDSIKGAQLAVDQINAAGGINGKTVQLLVGDSNSSPEGGKSAAQKLIADGVVGLLGEVASGITQQIASVAFDAGVPLIAVGATKTDITEAGDNLFRVCYTDDFQGPVMAKFAYDELKLRNVALMTDNKQPYSTFLSDSFRKAFEKLGGKIVDEQKYETAQTQFAAQIEQLKSKNPDGVFLSGYFNEVGPIASQMRQAGLTVPLLGGDGWDSSQLITSGGDAIVGGFFCNHYNSKENRPEVQQFLADWRGKYNAEPGTTMGALGYDAAKLMIDAIKRAEGQKSRDVTKAIEATTDFPGVSGKISLAGMRGNPAKPALVVKVTREGFVFEKAFTPEDLAGLM